MTFNAGAMPPTLTMKPDSTLFRLFVLALTLGATTVMAAANDPWDKSRRFNDYYEEEPEWEEAAEVTPPTFPADADLVPIYVSAVQTNQYLIDAKSLSMGANQVVRYTLVVRTAGGAVNISFEGMRCESREWKTYAVGHKAAEAGQSGTWSKARRSEWRPVENKPTNRHHAALSKDYFCPNGSSLRNADEGVDALRKGGHPDVPGNRK